MGKMFQTTNQFSSNVYQRVPLATVETLLLNPKTSWCTIGATAIDPRNPDFTKELESTPST